MEIKDFIAETLVQINEGLGDAQKRAGKHYTVSHGDKGTKGVFFSLAVTNAKSEEAIDGKGGGLHIKVIEAGLSSSNKSNSSHESISRIEFDVIVD